MNVRIFWVSGVEYMCALTRARFILSSERVFGEWSQNPCQLQGKNPLYRKNSPFRRIEPTRLHQAGGSFESVRWNACVHRLELGLYSHWKEFLGNGVRTHVNSKGKIPSTGKILLLGGSNPQGCIKQDSELNTLPMSYSAPSPPSDCLSCSVVPSSVSLPPSPPVMSVSFSLSLFLSLS